MSDTMEAVQNAHIATDQARQRRHDITVCEAFIHCLNPNMTWTIGFPEQILGIQLTLKKLEHQQSNIITINLLSEMLKTSEHHGISQPPWHHPPNTSSGHGAMGPHRASHTWLCLDKIRENRGDSQNLDIFPQFWILLDIIGITLNLPCFCPSLADTNIQRHPDLHLSQVGCLGSNCGMDVKLYISTSVFDDRQDKPLT